MDAASDLPDPDVIYARTVESCPQFGIEPPSRERVEQLVGELNRVFGILSLALALAAFALPSESMPGTPTGDPAGAAVVRRPVPEPAPPPVTSNPAAGSAPSRAAPPIVVPAGSIYVCVSESGGVRRETAIEFSPEVGALCAKHPEMGPCQYERNVCRRSGGRVYAAGGVEITLQMEADYDRKVMRVLIK